MESWPTQSTCLLSTLSTRPHYQIDLSTLREVAEDPHTRRSVMDVVRSRDFTSVLAMSRREKSINFTLYTGLVNFAMQKPGLPASASIAFSRSCPRKEVISRRLLAWRKVMEHGVLPLLLERNCRASECSRTVGGLTRMETFGYGLKFNGVGGV